MITSNREKDIEETNPPAQDSGREQTPTVLRDRESTEKTEERETDDEVEREPVKD